MILEMRKETDLSGKVWFKIYVDNDLQCTCWIREDHMEADEKGAFELFDNYQKRLSLPFIPGTEVIKSIIITPKT